MLLEVETLLPVGSGMGWDQGWDGEAIPDPHPDPSSPSQFPPAGEFLAPPTIPPPTKASVRIEEIPGFGRTVAAAAEAGAEDVTVSGGGVSAGIKLSCRRDDEVIPSPDDRRVFSKWGKSEY